MFPKTRLRRYRYSSHLRSILDDVTINSKQLIFPLFLKPGKNIKQEINSMPGIDYLSIDWLLKECEDNLKNGLKNFLIFSQCDSENKTENASYSYSEKGLVQKALFSLKKEFKDDIFLITDVCLCAYTKSGHCGFFDYKKEQVDNDDSLKILAQQALSHAYAGADMLAPSCMMDGIVFEMRKELDKNNFYHIPIMSYSIKYASSLYTPFRDVLDSKPIGDRKTYQISPYTSSWQAHLEAREDCKESSDIVMVKPSLFYLDIISEIKKTLKVPLAAYQVSGEYSMIQLAIEKMSIKKEELILESLAAIKRAGADLIITYFAKEFVKNFKK